MTPDLAALVERLQMAVKDYDEAVASPPARDLSNDWMMADVAMAHGRVFAQAKAAIESLAAENARLTGRDRKRGDYWISADGRAELRGTFTDTEDGNAVLPILNALERAEAERDAIQAAANAVVWFDWSDNDADAVMAIEKLRESIAGMPSKKPQPVLKSEWEQLIAERDELRKAFSDFLAAMETVYLETSNESISVAGSIIQSGAFRAAKAALDAALANPTAPPSR